MIKIYHSMMFTENHWKKSNIWRLYIFSVIAIDIGCIIINIRTKNKRLLELAKTAVEIAIEHGEEKGLELLSI